MDKITTTTKNLLESVFKREVDLQEKTNYIWHCPDDRAADEDHYVGKVVGKVTGDHLNKLAKKYKTKTTKFQWGEKEWHLEKSGKVNEELELEESHRIGDTVKFTSSKDGKGKGTIGGRIINIGKDGTHYIQSNNTDNVHQVSSKQIITNYRLQAMKEEVEEFNEAADEENYYTDDTFSRRQTASEKRGADKLRSANDRIAKLKKVTRTHTGSYGKAVVDHDDEHPADMENKAPHFAGADAAMKAFGLGVRQTVSQKAAKVVSHGVTTKQQTKGSDARKELQAKLKGKSPKEQARLRAEYRASLGEETELDESSFRGKPTVKTDKYSWGTMKTIHHGMDFSIPLHPEHHQAISKLNDGESHSFKDETKTNWTATRNGDMVNFKEKHYGNKTSVPFNSLKEESDLEEKFDGDEALRNDNYSHPSDNRTAAKPQKQFHLIHKATGKIRNTYNSAKEAAAAHVGMHPTVKQNFKVVAENTEFDLEVIKEGRMKYSVIVNYNNQPLFEASAPTIDGAFARADSYIQSVIDTAQNQISIEEYAKEIIKRYTR